MLAAAAADVAGVSTPAVTAPSAAAALLLLQHLLLQLVVALTPVLLAGVHNKQLCSTSTSRLHC
jgi:hypothetical protein